MVLSSETSFLKRLLSWSDDRSRFAFVAQITVKQNETRNFKPCNSIPRRSKQVRHLQDSLRPTVQHLTPAVDKIIAVVSLRGFIAPGVGEALLGHSVLNPLARGPVSEGGANAVGRHFLFQYVVELQAGGVKRQW